MGLKELRKRSGRGRKNPDGVTFYLFSMPGKHICEWIQPTIVNSQHSTQIIRFVTEIDVYRFQKHIHLSPLYPVFILLYEMRNRHEVGLKRKSAGRFCIRLFKAITY
jgi:hypothetical protein